MEAGEVFDMNCQEFWNQNPDVARHASARHLDHLRECPECAARLEGERALANGLRAWSAEMKKVQAPSSVEARLRAAFRSQNGLPGRGRWTPVFTWGAACAATVAAALFLVWARPQQQPAPSMRGADLAVVEMQEDGTADLGMPDGDGFVALPDAVRLDAGEDVNLVRLEVPRAALTALGLPVADVEASETVVADVKVGSDGVPRAVRLLE
jgi:hypothetical protein